MSRTERPFYVIWSDAVQAPVGRMYFDRSRAEVVARQTADETGTAYVILESVKGFEKVDVQEILYRQRSKE